MPYIGGAAPRSDVLKGRVLTGKTCTVLVGEGGKLLDAVRVSARKSASEAGWSKKADAPHMAQLPLCSWYARPSMMP